MGDLVVGFEGGGAGEGPLNWGQLQCWRTMVDVGSSLPMGQVMPFAGGQSVEHLADIVRFWVGRYAGLRTVLRIDGDAVSQVVHGTGEVVLRVVDAGDGEPAAVAAALLARWKAEPFDYGREWPIRVGAVTRDGRATHAVIVLCHLAADGAGIAVMGRELAERDAGVGPGAGPYAAMQPVELARHQATPAAQRQCAASLRFWEAQLRALPARRLAASAGGGPAAGGEDGPAGGEDGPAGGGDGLAAGGSPYRRVVWESTGLHRGARAVAARLGVDTAPVLLAAFALALRAVGGTDPVAAQVLVANRFRPGLADVVTPLVQSGLAVLDVGGVGLAEAVARAVRATMRASKYAYYDPDARKALIERVRRERGEPVELGVLWNDRRMSDRPTGPERTGLVQEEPMDFFNEQLMVNVEDVPGTVRMMVEVDTRHLAPAGVRALLAGMEAAVS